MTRPAIVTFAFMAAAATTALGCSSSEPDTSPETAGTGGSGGDGAVAGAGGSAGDAAVPGAGGAGASGGAAGTAGSEPAGDSGAGGAAGAAVVLPYAHVVAVSASGSDQSYQFSVSVESADIDCTQFANWWEVLGEDGTLLYRRILEHSHTDENGTSDADKPGNTFTRPGGPVAVGADTVVIVRAHMSTGGYNGRAMRGSPSGGFADAPNITSEFAADVEGDDPQPDGCDF
jgi:hypothetical protein